MPDIKVSKQKFKPTLDKENRTEHGENFEDNFNMTMQRHDVDLTEVDQMLNEKAKSIKKQIWDLAKMESLVHDDQKLSAIYNEMSEDGEEKYGYHYNETIMNIIFNEYVLNSVKYLAKYKSAVPVEKKRRDKTGINKLQSKGDGDETQSQDQEKEKNDVDEVSTHNNSLPGVPSDDVNELSDNNGGARDGYGDENDREYLNHRIEKKYDVDETTGAASSGSFSAKAGFDPMNDNDKIMYESMDNLEAIKAQAEQISREEGVAQHVNDVGNGQYEISDFYDADSTVASYENGRSLNESVINEKAESEAQQKLMGMAYAYKKGEMDDASKKVKELADSMSMEDLKDFASTKHDKIPAKKKTDEGEELDETTTSSSSGAYETPYAFSKGKPRHADNPAWDGGEMVNESYLTNPETFKLIYESLDEEAMLAEDKDPCWDGYKQVGMKDKDGKEVPNCVPIDEDTNDDSLVPNALEEHHLHTHNEKAEFVAQQTGQPVQIYLALSDEVVDSLYRAIEDYDEEQPALEVDVEESIIDDQPESMAAHMQGGGMPSSTGGMFEGENELRDFGTSEQGMGGSNDVTSPIDKEELKDPTLMGGKTIDDLNEDGNCRDGEIPNPDRENEDDPDCVRKDTYYKNKEEGKYAKNKKDQPKKKDRFNDEWRKEREKRMAKRKEAKKKQTNENIMDFNKEMDETAKLMESLKKISSGEELNEDAKHPSMVNLDRLRKDNEKNFKDEMKDSNSTEISANQGEAERADDQYTEIDDPQKLSQDIEKDKLSQNDGESFDNEGNSTNDTNDEIPKRNRTKEEQEKVALNRGYGMEALDYDLEPSERFKERAKKDMGEEYYDIGQEKIEQRDDQIMYKKDEQPVQDEDKYKEKHVNEGSMTGKYRDAKNTTQFVNFNFDKVDRVDQVDENYTKLSLDGLGNTYTQNIHENTNMRNVMDTFDFYINQSSEALKPIVAVKRSERKLMAEGEEKKEEPINEGLEKMKKLWGYKPHQHVNTHGTKKNRGF